MAIASCIDLVESIQKYELLEEVARAELAGLHERSSAPKELARELLSRGWLTPYQANQLLLGRGQYLVLGQYVLLERLGRGGMGQVYKARQRSLNRTVAVKVIRRDQAATGQALKRFYREIQAVAQLDHVNVVRAYDAAEVNGCLLLVMEYIAGAVDLAERVLRQGPLAVAQACDYIGQAAAGLQHACARGLVHRDIKPANLLLAGGGTRIKILDMGLALLQAGADRPMTGEGVVLGTPDFMAPEQARQAHQVDIRADIYSLGCTLYYLLTGQVPFPGGSMLQKLMKHQLETPRPVQALRPEVPAEVAAVLRTMMAREPKHRYQQPAEAAAALRGAASAARPGPAAESDAANAAAAPIDEAAIGAGADTCTDSGRADTSAGSGRRLGSLPLPLPPSPEPMSGPGVGGPGVDFEGMHAAASDRILGGRQHQGRCWLPLFLSVAAAAAAVLAALIVLFAR